MRWFDKKLDKVIELLEEARDILESLKLDQEEKSMNVPDNLQNSERYEIMLSREDTFETYMDSIDEALDVLKDIE